jgi:Protein of unknown function (DUF3306)
MAPDMLHHRLQRPQNKCAAVECPGPMTERDSNFLSRWSRRKVQAREGVAPPDETVLAPTQPAVAGAPAAVPAAAGAPPPQTQAGDPPAVAPPAPTLADVATLSPQSDYTRFVARGVTPEVKNAALKKLFTDPHFNLMDGLDTYIDDYGKPDPLPAGMLRQMLQSQVLGLFDDEKTADAAAPAPDAGLDAPCQPEAAARDPGAAPQA